jgi:hypothetical protein
MIAAMFSGAERITDEALRTSETVDTNKAHKFTVTNAWSADLTGMIVRADRQFPGYKKDLQFRYIYDCILNPRQPPLKTGDSYTFDTGAESNDLQPMHVVVEAAVFADGSALGEPKAIKSLWARRTWLSANFNTAFHDIDVSVQDKGDRSEIMKVLTDLKNKKLLNKELSLEDRQTTVLAYDTIIHSVERQPDTPPSKVIQNLKNDVAVRQKTMADQLAPAQLLQPN